MEIGILCERYASPIWIGGTGVAVEGHGEPVSDQVALRGRKGTACRGYSSYCGNTGSPDPLTRREVEVLRLMAGGYSNREIGDALGASEGTVKNHISSILSKMGVRDRIRAALKGLESGCI